MDKPQLTPEIVQGLSEIADLIFSELEAGENGSLPEDTSAGAGLAYLRDLLDWYANSTPEPAS